MSARTLIAVAGGAVLAYLVAAGARWALTEDPVRVDVESGVSNCPTCEAAKSAIDFGRGLVEEVRSEATLLGRLMATTRLWNVEDERALIALVRTQPAKAYVGGSMSDAALLHHWAVTIAGQRLGISTAESDVAALTAAVHSCLGETDSRLRLLAAEALLRADRRGSPEVLSELERLCEDGNPLVAARAFSLAADAWARRL